MSWLPANPVPIDLKESLFAALACFITIFMVAQISLAVAPNPNVPIIVASVGPSTIMLYFSPNSPMSRPWSVIGGQLVSCLVGIACAQFIADQALAAASSVFFSVLAMLLLRCLHPPGTASALVPLLSSQINQPLAYSFAIFPLLFNVMVMLVIAIVINLSRVAFQRKAISH